MNEKEMNAASAAPVLERTSCLFIFNGNNGPYLRFLGPDGSEKWSVDGSDLTDELVDQFVGDLVDMETVDKKSIYSRTRGKWTIRFTAVNEPTVKVEVDAKTGKTHEYRSGHAKIIEIRRAPNALDRFAARLGDKK